MEAFLFKIIGEISFLIGVVGILVIVLGSLRAFFQYIFSIQKNNFERIRLTLGSHLILGLDFLVGKDIIDTLLLDSNEVFFTDLAGLITVVTIRIVLTFFTEKELEKIEQREKDNVKRKS